MRDEKKIRIKLLLAEKDGNKEKNQEGKNEVTKKKFAKTSKRATLEFYN